MMLGIKAFLLLISMVIANQAFKVILVIFTNFKDSLMFYIQIHFMD
jgi:hypothetical protein